MRVPRMLKPLRACVTCITDTGALLYRGNEHCKKALIATAHDDDIQSRVASIYIRKKI